MEHIASWLIAYGKSVCITTTTKIYAKKPFRLFAEGIERGTFLRVGKDLSEGKLTGLSYAEVERLGDHFDFVLVEADGAKGMPLKCPRADEPLIPPISDRVFVIAGLDALGSPLRQKVLRWEVFCEKKGTEPEEIIGGDIFLSFFNKDVLLKNVEERKGVVVLNRYDLLKERKGVLDLARQIYAKTGLKVLAGSLLFDFFYLVEGRDGG